MSTSIVWDIETGGLPEEELKKLYHEKTAEEFSADCDKRWKPETIAAKYEEYKVSGWEEFQERGGAVRRHRADRGHRSEVLQGSEDPRRG